MYCSLVSATDLFFVPPPEIHVQISEKMQHLLRRSDIRERRENPLESSFSRAVQALGGKTTGQMY
jgi:hypothetical protein